MGFQPLGRKLESAEVGVVLEAHDHKKIVLHSGTAYVFRRGRGLATVCVEGAT